jgi:hypothetical protein
VTGGGGLPVVGELEHVFAHRWRKIVAMAIRTSEPPAAGALSSLALQNSPPSDARTSEIGLNLGRF